MTSTCRLVHNWVFPTESKAIGASLHTEHSQHGISGFGSDGPMWSHLPKEHGPRHSAVLKHVLHLKPPGTFLWIFSFSTSECSFLICLLHCFKWSRFCLFQTLVGKVRKARLGKTPCFHIHPHISLHPYSTVVPGPISLRVWVLGLCSSSWHLSNAPLLNISGLDSLPWLTNPWPAIQRIFALFPGLDPCSMLL